MRLISSGCFGSNDERNVFGRDRHVIRDFTMEPATTHTKPKHTRKGICVANALFRVCAGVGDYTLPLDHSVLVRSDICHLGCHGDMWDYVWRT